MLRIGDFSKLSRISVRMLRHYDEIGLLVPVNTDKDTKYRYYTEGQLTLANKIAAFKDMGFSLSILCSILNEDYDVQTLEKLLVQRTLEVEALLETTTKQKTLLDNTLAKLRKDEEIMNYNVMLKTIPTRYVASVRDKIPSYGQEGILWNTLMKETAMYDLQVSNPSYSLAMFHDEYYKEHDVDVEVQMCVKKEYKNTQHVVFKEAKEMNIASATYQGSYDEIAKVNEAVALWVSEQGYEFSGPSFCIYHVSPHETNNPEEFVTEVCYQVLKK